MFRRTSALAITLLLALAELSQAGTAPTFSVGPQYDTTHVYVSPADFDKFIASFSATFGGTMSKQGVFQVTATPSQTMSQLALTPAGTISVFGFKTPIPYPFGLERTGYLVTDMDRAVKAAHAAGADIVVAPFDDPIGRDAVIQWPGGVGMQLYWHIMAPNYPALSTVPENRVYVSPMSGDIFLRDFIRFSKGHVTSDDRTAPGVEIGRPSVSYRRVDVESGFGKMRVIVSDGHLTWPYGRELTGYEVADLDTTVGKAKDAGATILVAPFISGDRNSAMIQFPGGYIAEVHAKVR